MTFPARFHIAIVLGRSGSSITDAAFGAAGE